ncbi:unnamed protein product [Parnassius apollo]|uniref:(apollo) hypothetical protein n=1 Tax=Parnassius apollo TaxID=110799 RepID=A0A8S3Y6X0_PARAO|nr:unnamed protein product [Parnassius apollo]
MSSKSRAWDYFKKTNEKFAKCSLCKREFKLSGNTTNLIDHMKRKHNEVWMWSSTVSVTQDVDTTEQNEKMGPSPKKRNTLKNYFDRSSKYPDGKTKQNLDNKYVRMIAVDMEPLRKGEHEGFRDFVNALDSRYEIPDTTILKKKLLPEYYENVKQKLVIALSKPEHVSVTTDLWTSIANEGILSVTCHFFHNEKLIAPLLEVVKMEGSHNAENIASMLDATLSKWDIRSKCEAITTDNAQTMINAAAKLHIRHIPCFAHTLNLTVSDSFAVTCLDQILKKCKSIVTFFKMSTLASDKLRAIQRELNKPELKVIQEVPTRWNSAYHMLQRIVTMKTELTLALNECNRAPPGVNADEYLIIQETIQILEPFDLATTKISGESYITLSLIIPLIRGIKTKLVEVESQIVTESGNKILLCMMGSVDKRLSPYESRTPVVLATILDPRFKKKGFKTSDDEKRAGQWLEKAYASHLTKERLAVEETQPTPSTSSGTSNDLLGFLDVPDVSTPLSNSLVDVRQYLEKPVIDRKECPITYWKYTNNKLKELAMLYLCIPASSVPSERIFSKAGQILTERRNRLKEKRLNELLFIKQNSCYFND